MTRYAAHVTAALLVLALGACSSGDPVLAPTGDVAGEVTLGPNCPVSGPGIECPPPQPPSGTVRAVKLDGGFTGETSTLDSNGRYELTVPAGAYILEATVEGAMSCTPTPVTVVADGLVEQPIMCDTGIR